MNKSIVWLVRLLLLVILSSIAVLAVNASVPVRAEDGCTIGSRAAGAYGFVESLVSPIPFYLVRGDVLDEKWNRCPTHRSDHTLHKRITDLRIPFTEIVVGHYEEVHSSKYLTVDTEEFVKFFPLQDVFVLSKREWNFKEFRK